MNDILEEIRPEIIRHMVNSFNTKEFITDVLYSSGIQNSSYKNAVGMFAWNKPYSEIEKMEQLFDDILVFPASTNAWNFPLVYDKKTQIIFMLMSENNLNQRRKQKVTEEHSIHYSKILSGINQLYSNQIPLFRRKTKNPISILKQFSSDERIQELPEDIKLVIVSSQKIQGDLLKVSGALYDKNLLLIDKEADWSSFIDTDYDSNGLTTSKTQTQIAETNANTSMINTMKENLVTLKQNTNKEIVNGIENYDE
jgi:hypothetical protein